MSGSRPLVVLLRSGEDADPYEAALAAEGFRARSIPVLEFAMIHQQELRIALEHPKSYDGLILTSPRAVEAVADAMPWLPSENLVWHGKSVFALGQRTAAELRTIGFEPEGEESGSAALLADYIAERRFERPLLFLCGDRRRDELPDRLQEAGVAIEELCVYRSIPRAAIDWRGVERPAWIVVFSPSGLEALQASRHLDLSGVRLAAIGPTSAGATRRRGYVIDAVAESPSPAGLAAAVRAASQPK